MFGAVRPAHASLVASAAGAFAILAPVAPVQAQDFNFGRPNSSLTMRVGYFAPRAESDLFDFTIDNLTVERDDFGAASLEFEYRRALTDQLSLAFGVAFNESNVQSESREFIGTDGLPILQETRFARAPLNAGVRYHLVRPGRRISSLAWISRTFVPYVDAGIGWAFFEFEQEGEFVDEVTLDIWWDHFTTEGSSSMAYAGAGFEYTLGKRVAMDVGGRYIWSDASIGGSDYVGFEGIDLSGMTFTAGLNVRW